MDPLTAIGAVASIAQLAQIALSLSKTLYSLGAAIASANDDIQILADDLKTFSQSLTLLSRLLEDGKAWYSDDIYLLTAKIIKDCAELYVKIDKILVKLGGNGKCTWKLRVKFVYKEGQIRKLMKRLRDMKGTLATILISLQVDLQLSLLNISSSSKIQREPEKPLQPETIQTLVDAQKVAQQTGFLSRYTVHSQHVIHSADKGYDVLKSQCEGVSQTPPAGDPRTYMEWTQSSHPENEPSLQTKCPIQPDSTVTRGIETGPANAEPTPAMRLFQPINMMVHQQIHQNTAKTEISACERTIAQSLRSTSSVESFQTAVSVQRSLHKPEARNEVEQHVEAVRSVLHTFRTALEVLRKLVEKRRLVKKQELYPTTKHLEMSLTEGVREFNSTHDRHCKLHGRQYIEAFTDSHNTALEDVGSALIKDVVMPLRMYTADHVILRKTDLETLRACSERCQVQAIFIIVDVASPLGTTYPEINIDPHSSLFHSKVAAEPPVQYVNPKPPTRPPQNATKSEAGLPFICYTFKRFDNNFRGDPHTAQAATSIEPDKKDPDPIAAAQPVPMHGSESSSTRESPPRLSTIINPEVLSVPSSSNSQEFDGCLYDLFASSVPPPFSLSSPAYSHTSPIVNGGIGGQGYPTRATSVRGMGPPILGLNNPQLQQSQGQQIIPQRQLRITDQSQYLDMPLQSPNSTGQRMQAQPPRLQSLRQQQGQGPLNSSPSNGLEQPQTPIGTPTDFGSFLGNVGIDQQQQVVIAQETGQMPVLGNGAQRNATPQPQFVLPSLSATSWQQQQINQPLQQAPRQARMGRQRSGMPMGVPNGMDQMTQAQFTAMSEGPIARTVNLPQHSLEQQQPQQQYMHMAQQGPPQTAQIVALQQYHMAVAAREGRPSALGNRIMSLQGQIPTMATLNAPFRTPYAQGNSAHSILPTLNTSEMLAPAIQYSCWSAPQQQMNLPQQKAMQIAQPTPTRATFSALANQTPLPTQPFTDAISAMQDDEEFAVSHVLGDPPSTPLSTTVPPQGNTISANIEDYSTGKATGSTGQALDETPRSDSDSGEHRTSILVKKKKLKQLKQEREQRATPASYQESPIFSQFSCNFVEPLESSSPSILYLPCSAPRSQGSDDLGHSANYLADTEPEETPRTYMPLHDPTDLLYPLGHSVPRTKPDPYQHAASAGAQDSMYQELQEFQDTASFYRTYASVNQSQQNASSWTPADHRMRNFQTGFTAFEPPGGPAVQYLGSAIGSPSEASYRSQAMSLSVSQSSHLSRSQSSIPEEELSSTETITERNGKDVKYEFDTTIGTKNGMERLNGRGSARKRMGIRQGPLTNEAKDKARVVRKLNDALEYPLYPPSLTLSYMSETSRPVNPGSQLPYLGSQYGSQPMLIRGARSPLAPPLPPPQHLADTGGGGNNGPDIAWQWGNAHEAHPNAHQLFGASSDNTNQNSVAVPDSYGRVRTRPLTAMNTSLTTRESSATDDEAHTVPPTSDTGFANVPSGTSPPAIKRKLAMVEESCRNIEQEQLSRKKKRTSDGSTMSGPTSSTTPTPASKLRQRLVPPQYISEGKEELSVKIVSLDRFRSDGPFMELWWQAYCFLNSSQPVTFESLSSETKKQYGEFLSNISDHNLSRRVTDLVEGIGLDRYRGGPYLMPLAAYRANVVKVVMTISSQLGLEKPVMGWAFVGVLLSIYERLFETWDRSIPITDVEAITKSFQQLQDLAGLLARYAVMENLYHQNASLTLTPEYRNGLQGLCISILQYFGNAIIVVRAAGKEESTSVVESRKNCDVLINEIKEKDKACQGFRVVVDADKESDTESEDTEIEDVGDGSWEVLGTERFSASELVT